MKYQNGEFSAAGWTKILNRWTKGNHDRIYINNDNSRHTTCGYIDLKTREVNWAAYAYSVIPGAQEYVNAILDLEF